MQFRYVTTRFYLIAKIRQKEVKQTCTILKGCPPSPKCNNGLMKSHLSFYLSSNNSNLYRAVGRPENPEGEKKCMDETTILV